MPNVLYQNQGDGTFENVAKKAKDRLILGADTIVVLNGEILGKPLDREDAFRILKKLSGKEHKVYTGITLLDKKNKNILRRYMI